MIRIFTSICIAFVFFNGACIVFIFPSPAHGRNLRLREHQSSLSVPLCLLLVWNRSVCTFVPSSGSFVAPQQATTALLLLVAYNITPAAVTDQNTKSWKFLPKRSKTPLDHHNVTLPPENFHWAPDIMSCSIYINNYISSTGGNNNYAWLYV